MTRQVQQPPLTARASLRWAVVAPLVSRLKPTEILELGCGQGSFGARLATLGHYTGVEPDESSWNVAHERIAPQGGTVLHGDHHKVPEGSQYDLVCAFEVLEHLSDDASPLAEWVQFAKPGGDVLVSVPADQERYGPSDELVGHYRRYSPQQLAELLGSAGLTDISVRRYGWPLCYLLEVAHNRVAARKLNSAADTAEERSATSGRFLQPTGAAGGLIRLGVKPFNALQHLAPRKGTWLVAQAKRPTA
ncbi:MAG: class I SAM-dependent methyltransferase [Micromonosporaceae bacterium]